LIVALCASSAIRQQKNFPPSGTLAAPARFLRTLRKNIYQKTVNESQGLESAFTALCDPARNVITLAARANAPSAVDQNALLNLTNGSVSVVQDCANFSPAELIEIPRASPPPSGSQARFFLCRLKFDKPRNRCLVFSKMKFIEHLFHRHPHSPESVIPTSYDWPGYSGTKYHFEIHTLNVTLRPMPGVYIYAKHLADGDWSPIYISQTRDLHQRLEGHVRLADAVAHGATHLHAHYCSAGQSARHEEEHDLIKRWRPECND
jgi:hypothetical protein